MKKKNTLKIAIGLLIIIAVVLLILFIKSKNSLIDKYKVNEREINTSEIFKDEIEVKTSTSKYDVLKYENISFRNDFKDHKKKDNNWYTKEDKAGVTLSALNISKITQYYNLLNDEDLNNLNEYQKEILFNKEDNKTLLKDLKINNDIDLLTYIKDHYYLKNTIFSSTNKMKQNYIINRFTEEVFPPYESITLLKGDLSGYVLNINSQYKEIHILDKDNQFIITLLRNDSVKEEYLKDFLNTIKIN